MSCNRCNQFQNGDLKSYYRWKSANIEMVGCPEHLKEIMDALNKVQEEEKEKNNGKSRR